MNEAMQSKVVELPTFAAGLEIAREVIGDESQVDQVLIVIAKKDGQLETITDISKPIGLTVLMAQAAIKDILSQQLAMASGASD